MKKHILIAPMLAIAATTVASAQVASDVWTFEVNDEQALTATVTGLEEAAGTVVAIAVEFAEGSRLATIGRAAFSHNAAMRSIELPPTVTEIGMDAFNQCGLERIAVPEGVTRIENSTFNRCPLVEAVLPDGVTYIGNSAFCDFIHNLQLRITKADISFNAPLAFDAGIEAGDVRVSDMFNLYKYENQICVLRMTGKEIHDYLEMSYALWTNRMTSPTDHIMLLERDEHGGYGFKNLAFNFDSAAGIDYEVDVTQPEGRKVKIIRMSDGRPFDETAWYDVAMNSYRGNGGGELLTKGAGIPHDSLKGRTAYESERDQRYYLMKEIEAAGTMEPQPNSNWRFVPDNWTRQAIIRDKELLFGGKNKTMKQQR